MIEDLDCDWSPDWWFASELMDYDSGAGAAAEGSV